MIIMLEGPDLAGKTTLAKMIRRRIKNSVIVHRGPPTGTWDDEYLKPLQEMYETGGAYILDRWHWGETIYGPILRGRSIVDDDALEVIETWCTEHGVTRVLLMPSYELLRKRWEQQGDELVTSLTQLMQIAGEYQRLPYDTRFTVNFIGKQPADDRVVAWLIAEAALKAEAHGWYKRV